MKDENADLPQTEMSDLQSREQKLADRQSVLGFVTREADQSAQEAYEKKQARDKEKIELIGGKVTSVYEEKQIASKILADLPQNHDPKFAYFFPALGKLACWTDKELESFYKPPIAAKTINEVIYDRFPKEVMSHIHAKNPYIRWCVRQHKNYFFLADDGILMLERFIDDAVTLMNESTSVYEFRLKHAQTFGTGFQQELFKQ